MGFLKIISRTIQLLVLFSFFSVSNTQQHNSDIFSYSAHSFNQSDLKDIVPLNSASIYMGALQLTPYSSFDDLSILNKSGRAMFNQRFKLWDDDEEEHKSLISFNSSFVINIYPPSPSKVPAEGLAFIVAPNFQMPLSSSYGGYLGLIDEYSDGNATNKFIAIEFDTFKQDYDPDDNHCGLNVNGVRSVKTVSLSDFGIKIGSRNRTAYNVWVQYNGSSMVLSVFMVEEGKARPINPILSEIIDLRKYLNQYSYFGFSASTGKTAQQNAVTRWDLTVESISRGIVPKKKNKAWFNIVLGMGIPGTIFLIIGLAYLGYFYCYRPNQIDVEDQTILEALKRLPGTPREFRYKDVKKATKNFDEKMKLGQGGFGVVYKGILANECPKEIAVKKFSREPIKGIGDFLSELTIINRLRHKHLVPLIGWCHRKEMMLLVYEFMPNGSLDHHLYGGPEKLLRWDQRFKIISGVASALHYLHNEYDQKVIHRDLKASNIMLDSDFNARLGDFGLARAISNERTSLSALEGVPGTVGYIPPEYYLTGKATRDSDVFGFGAVVLEVVCGQRPWTQFGEFELLVDWVWELYSKGRILEAVDEGLKGDYVHQEAQKLLLLGLACSHPLANERPRSDMIIQIISGSIQPPDVPRFKPAFVWPVRIERNPLDDSSPTSVPDFSGLHPR